MLIIEIQNFAMEQGLKVVVRVRPLQDPSEKSCVQFFYKEPKVSVNKEIFTFDYVFDELDENEKLYKESVKGFLKHLIAGFNVSILAYGQTGSGKTFTMGTVPDMVENGSGIVPNILYDIFAHIAKTTDFSFSASLSVLEFYNEHLYDLLTTKAKDESEVDVRENINGTFIPGLVEETISSYDNAILILEKGLQKRTTRSRLQNFYSSRSHALIIVNITITNKRNPKDKRTPRLFLVDLAGSESLKSVGTVDLGFKEGVSINKGLLALGTVITKLGEKNTNYINYRDSKLTRILQESLGGNSLTLMIACINPDIKNKTETLNTLRYAQKAKKIINAPLRNIDPHSALVADLESQLNDCKLQLIESILSPECPCESSKKEVELIMKKQFSLELIQTVAEQMCFVLHLLENKVKMEKRFYVQHQKCLELWDLLECYNITNDKRAKNMIIEDIKSLISSLQDEQSLHCVSSVNKNNSFETGNTGEKYQILECLKSLLTEHLLDYKKLEVTSMEISGSYTFLDQLYAKKLIYNKLKTSIQSSMENLSNHMKASDDQHISANNIPGPSGNIPVPSAGGIQSVLAILHSEKSHRSNEIRKLDYIKRMISEEEKYCTTRIESLRAAISIADQSRIKFMDQMLQKIEYRPNIVMSPIVLKQYLQCDSPLYKMLVDSDLILRSAKTARKSIELNLMNRMIFTSFIDHTMNHIKSVELEENAQLQLELLYQSRAKLARQRNNLKEYSNGKSMSKEEEDYVIACMLKLGNKMNSLTEEGGLLSCSIDKLSIENEDYDITETLKCFHPSLNDIKDTLSQGFDMLTKFVKNSVEKEVMAQEMEAKIDYYKELNYAMEKNLELEQAKHEYRLQLTRIKYQAKIQLLSSFLNKTE